MNSDLDLLLGGTEDDKEAAAERLMAAGVAALPDVRRALQSLEADVRWWAVRALAGIPGEKADVLLLGALEDADEDVRVCAILGLGERSLAAAVEPLLELLPAANSYVARHIGDALSKIGEPAVGGLIQTLSADSPAVRVQAARALVRIESHAAIPALIAALDDPEPVVEHYAWEALQRMGVGSTVFFNP